MSNWLIVPIYRKVFPSRIYQIANQVGETPETIAKNENVQAGRSLKKALSYEQLCCITDIEEYEEDQNACYVTIEGQEEMPDYMVVQLSVEDFCKKVTSFIKKYEHSNNLQQISVPFPIITKTTNKNEI